MKAHYCRQILVLLLLTRQGKSWNTVSCSFSERQTKNYGSHHALSSSLSSSVETDLYKRGFQYIIGADESGRGCIAGPVVVASCCVLSNHQRIPGVDDSKKLTKEQRYRIYQAIIDNPNVYAWNTVLVHPQQIDESNVLRATLNGFASSIESLVQQHNFSHNNTYTIVDGNKSPKLEASLSQVSCRPFVKADGKVYTVALASILAKVTHERYMTELHTNYPRFGFNQHHGYPTRKHIQAIHSHGPIEHVHRMSCKPLKGRGIKTTTTTSRRTLLAMITMGSSSSLLLPTTSTRPSIAMMTDPKTGIALPDVGEIENAVPTDWSEVENPFATTTSTKQQFSRLDSSNDGLFYADPRFVEHVDDNAVQLLTNYISNQAIQQKDDAILDLCSSWTSHIDKTAAAASKATRIAGLGMNEKELSSNPVLTEYTVQDLNQNPILPYQDNSFSVVLCQLSIDYLTRPLEVLKEAGRILKPGGRIHILFSNRLFISKAVAIWTGADDIDHAYTVACYLHFCNGGFDNIQAQDISTRGRNNKRILGDPLYVVTATKS